LPKKYVIAVANRLRKIYPSAKVFLNHKDTFQLLVATILSAQCTDLRVNKVLPRLFKKYKTIQDFSRARELDLQKQIHSTGLYRAKAQNIIKASRVIIKEFGGNVPDSMIALKSLPGVGRKTANIVLASAFKKAEGIAVDTHVKRLSLRLGLTRHQDPDKVEKDLTKLLPISYWLDFNFILVSHGRAVCKALKPVCQDCILSDLCPSAKESR